MKQSIQNAKEYFYSLHRKQNPFATELIITRLVKQSMSEWYKNRANNCTEVD